MKIVCAMTERRQKVARNDDARGEGDESRSSKHLRLDGTELVERARETERQCGIMRPEQVAERALLMRRRGQKDDRLEHVPSASSSRHMRPSRPGLGIGIGFSASGVSTMV
jgi:hypothetical protein